MTVVVACLNEAKYLDTTLGSIQDQNYAGRITTIVVDGGSKDESLEVVARIQSTAPPNRPLVLLQNPYGHAAWGFRMGMEKSTSKFTMICGARTLLAPTHIATAVELLSRHASESVAVVGGGISSFVPRDQSRLAQAISFLYASPLGAGAAGYLRRKTAGIVDTVYCGMYSTEVALRVGNFDPRFVRGQDSELNARIRSHGFKILFSPQLSPTYRFNIDFRGVVRRGIRTGSQVSRGWLHNPSSLRLRHLAPLGLVTTVLGLAAMAFLVPEASTALAGILTLYLATLCVEGIRLSNRDFLLGAAIVAVFSTYQISYGLGQLMGLVRQLTRLPVSRAA